MKEVQLWKVSFDSRKLALTSAMAGIYAIFRFVPLSKLIGLQGFITASGMVVPVLAFILDPAYGIIAVFIGTVIGFASPNNAVRFAGLDFLPGAINLTIASLAFRGKRIQASLVFLGVIATFVAIPYTTIFVGSSLLSPPLPYFWLHLIALFTLFTPLSRNLRGRVESGNYFEVGIAVAFLAFTGTMAEHLAGGVLFASFLGPGAQFAWRAIYLLYPIERLVIVVGAVLVCSATIMVLRALSGRLPALKRV